MTGDMLKGPFKYFGGVVEPWWVNSLGVGIHVQEGVPLFYRWLGIFARMDIRGDSYALRPGV